MNRKIVGQTDTFNAYLSALPDGIYFFKLALNGYGVFFQKIVLSK